jgi:hypothetical protein
MKLTENEKAILKKIRAMKPHDKLIVEKKGEKDPTEFRVEVQSVEYLKRDLLN